MSSFAPLLLLFASPAVGQSVLPADVTDGMYMTLAEARANSEQIYDAIAGPGGEPISKSSFVATNLPGSVASSAPDRTLLGKLFEQLDADRDDRLTRKEWQNRLQRELSFADANSDGRITMKELANARANMSFGDALGMIF